MGSLDVSDYFTKFGFYQFYLLIIAVTTSIYAAFIAFVHLFLSENRNYRCFIPNCDNDTSPYSVPWLNQTIPHTKLNGVMQSNCYEKCTMYTTNSTENWCDLDTFNRHPVTCNKWVFEVPHETLDRKWGLLCDKQWMWDSTESVFMAGILFSTLFIGIICDKIGRKKAFLIYSLILCSASVSNYFSFNFKFYLAMNFFIGVGSQFTLPAYNLFLESLPSKSRTTYGLLLGYTYAIGELLLALIAYFSTSWQTLLMVVSFSSLVVIPLYLMMPESIYWLATRSDKKKLKFELARMSKWNKLNLDLSHLDEATNEGLCEEDSDFSVESVPEQSSFGNPLLLFKTPYLRRCTIAEMIIWFCISFTYYGVSLGSKSLGKNYLVTFALLAAVEIPGITISLVVLLKYGRKPIQVILLMITGCVCLLSIVLPDEFVMWKTALAVIGKGCVSAQWSTNIVYLVEIYPTVVRNVGYSMASSSARLSAIIAAYVPDLAQYYEPLPMIIFGACGIIAGIAMLFLPETANKKLMNTIEEAELFHKRNMFKSLTPSVSGFKNTMSESRENLTKVT